MSLPGSFSVNQGGAAAYSIPIAVPPGTAGVVPSLSLDYSSSGANGIMGIGWSLGGLPSVGRCPRTMVQDGVIGTVNFDGNDRFCLDGQRLILVSGSYGADGAEYRTEIDVYSKIVSHGTAGNGPAWFEVRTKAGQVMEFGHTADSQMLVVGKAMARAWGVNKVSDTKGNYLSVTYVTNASTGQSVPSWIVYTGNASAGVAPYNSVAFVYAQRPDVIQHYHAGSLVQTTDRLTNIKTFAGATLVADYRLSYQQSPTSGVSEVTSIAACGGDGSCLPASTFQWASGGGDSFSAAVMAVPNGANFGSPSSTTSGAGRGHVLQGAIGFTPIYSDFDGDGRTDFLMLYGPNLFAFLSKGDGTYTFVNSSAPNGWNFGNDPFSSYALISGDFNGDGKSEFAMLSGGVVYTFLSNGDGTFRGVATPCPNGWNFGAPPQATYTTIAGDFNSDGRSDFLLMSGQFMYEFLSNGDGTFSGNTINIGPTNFGNRPSDNYTPISGDFNGDGKADFIMMGGAYLYEFFGNGDGTFAYSALQISNGWNFGSPPDNSFVPISGDFNGDGKTDWVMLQGTYLYQFQSKGDGTFNYITIPIPSSVGWNFGAQPAALFSPLSGDFNADGKSDFAFIGGNSPFIYQFISNGDATFSYHLLPMPNNWNFGAPVTASYWLFGGDFKGDGKAGFTLLDATHVYSVMANGGAGDYIVGFTTGLGVTTAVTYKPITSSAVYTKDTTATYPYVDLQSASFVVSRVDVSNGVGGTYSSTYAYAGAKADITGRGMLGFRQMTVNDLQTGISDVTTFRQDFPYIGMVASTVRTLGSQTLGQSTNTYQFTNATGTTTISPSSAPYRVSLAQNVASGSDLDGSVLPTVTTANQYDAYGNATRVTVSTPDGYSKTTVNTYSNDPSLWYLGRLTRASVTSVAP